MASRHFKIQGLQVNVHCLQNRLNAVTKLSEMYAGQKNSSLIPKMSAKAASCDACVRDVALILKFQCRTSIFRPERAGVDKIRLADLLKIHIGVKLDPQVGKSFCKRGNSIFLLALNTNPPRQEADRDNHNQNILF